MKIPLDFVAPEDAAPPNPLDCPFWKFEVQCLACGSYRLHLECLVDATTGNPLFCLACTSCGHQERMPARLINLPESAPGD